LIFIERASGGELAATREASAWQLIDAAPLVAVIDRAGKIAARYNDRQRVF